MTRTIAADTDITPTFAIAEGVEAVRQCVQERLRLHRGEDYRAADTGVPWFQVFLDLQRGSALAVQIVSAEIQGVEGVTRVRDMQVQQDRQTRRLTYTANVETIHGQAAVSAEVER